MADLDILEIEVDSDLKNKAEKILNNLGIDMENAIIRFLEQIILTKSIPFNTYNNI